MVIRKRTGRDGAGLALPRPMNMQCRRSLDRWPTAAIWFRFIRPTLELTLHRVGLAVYWQLKLGGR